MKRKTQIICTIGPASNSISMLRKLAQEGMDIARLNFSHGTHAEHQKVINNIRRVNRQGKKRIRILQDLEGYRIRLGCMQSARELRRGQEVWISSRKRAKKIIPLDCDFDFKKIKKGSHIYIADGTIDLQVIQVSSEAVQARVLQGGSISSKKGVNIPGLKLKANIFTQKDHDDLHFGMKNQVDFVAQSFVRNKSDIQRVVSIVRPLLQKCRVIAKIENKEGVDHIDQIIGSCDGIMVARGDLGVSLPIYQVPVLQKRIIARTNKKNKIDITATQMLESMLDHNRPTRAEVSDIANAVFDGSDCVMLSGETAVGHYPVEAVRIMRQVIEYSEKEMRKLRKRPMVRRK